jgi:hypothetical protein
MNTDKLIQILASDPLRDSHPTFKRQLLLSIGFGGGISFFMMATILKIRPDLMFAATQPFFWLKIGFALSLLGVGLYEATKTAFPGNPTSNLYWKVSIPILVVWFAAFWTATNPSSPQTIDLVKGSTWQVCSLLIAFLSIPIFILIFYVLKDMACVKPRLTGFMAGLFSGGLAASIYSLHCPELSPVFLGIWYLLGMMIPAIAGALLGGKILRW